MRCYFQYETALGTMTFGEQDGFLTDLHFGTQVLAGERQESPLLREAYEQLCQYLCGERRQFSVPLRPAGTPFQQSVWAALQQIPYGTTVSYKALAKAVGNEQACRAVGMANHRNPIAIMIPCHRVVGANGSLTGYASGLDRKQQLLTLEQNQIGGNKNV